MHFGNKISYSIGLSEKKSGSPQSRHLCQFPFKSEVINVKAQKKKWIKNNFKNIRIWTWDCRMWATLYYYARQNMWCSSLCSFGLNFALWSLYTQGFVGLCIPVIGFFRKIFSGSRYFLILSLPCDVHYFPDSQSTLHSQDGSCLADFAVTRSILSHCNFVYAAFCSGGRFLTFESLHCTFIPWKYRGKALSLSGVIHAAQILSNSVFNFHLKGYDLTVMDSLVIGDGSYQVLC